MDAFGCDAPQFLDLENLDEHEDQERIEAYFDSDHERLSRQNTYEVDGVENEAEETDEIFYTPMHNNELQHQNRLSISMICLSEMNQYNKEEEDENLEENDENLEENDLSETLQNTHISVKAEQETIPSVPDAQRSRQMTPRMNNSAMLRTKRSRSNSELNTTGRQGTQRAPPKAKDKYVSMLEAMKKFERSTPERFHSKPKGTGPSIERLLGPVASTIPQSPVLATKIRQRPTTALSSQELELRQYEEQKKFKIRANPVNRKVLEPMKPIHFAKKPLTQFQPFHITEVTKKVQPTQPKFDAFHARAMPKAAPKPIVLKKKCVTTPVTPNVLRNHPPKIAPKKEEEKPREWKPSTTNIIPFTFDERDKKDTAKKEMRLQHRLEEERRIREFHARPMPKKIYENPVPVKMTRWAGSTESIKSVKSDDGNKVFKSRPAVLLQKEPFIPKKSDRPLTAVSEFQLNLDKRASERREFDEQMKEKERQVELQRILQQEEALCLEERMWREHRKLCQHKAQPIRKFKELQTIQAKLPTIPHTPNFAKRRHNKENLPEPLSQST